MNNCFNCTNACRGKLHQIKCSLTGKRHPYDYGCKKFSKAYKVVIPLLGSEYRTTHHRKKNCANCYYCFTNCVLYGVPSKKNARCLLFRGDIPTTPEETEKYWVLI